MCIRFSIFFSVFNIVFFVSVCKNCMQIYLFIYLDLIFSHRKSSKSCFSVSSHRKEMSLPHTPAADLPQICSRPAADSHLFHMQISFAADLPQTCRRLFQYDEESAAGLPHTCRRPAAYSYSMMKSLRQVCRRLAADLPHTLSVWWRVCCRPAADSSSWIFISHIDLLQTCRILFHIQYVAIKYAFRRTRDHTDWYFIIDIGNIDITN